MSSGVPIGRGRTTVRGRAATTMASACCDNPCYAVPIYADLSYPTIIEPSGLTDEVGFAFCACGDPSCTDSCDAALNEWDVLQLQCQQLATNLGLDPAKACPIDVTTQCGFPAPPNVERCPSGWLRFDVLSGTGIAEGLGMGVCAPAVCCDGTPITSLENALACGVACAPPPPPPPGCQLTCNKPFVRDDAACKCFCPCERNKVTV